jgi:hypothetical protein
VIKILIAVLVAIGIVALIFFFGPRFKVVSSMTPPVSGSDEQVWEDIRDSNIGVLKELEKAGDKREKVRTVDHYAYFKKEEDAQKFESWVKTIGAKTEPIHKIQGDFSVAFTLDHDVKAETIGPLTKKLFDKCLELNGEYDGWGCTVAN